MLGLPRGSGRGTARVKGTPVWEWWWVGKFFAVGPSGRVSGQDEVRAVVVLCKGRNGERLMI